MKHTYQIQKKLKQGVPLTRKQAKALRQNKEAYEKNNEEVSRKLSTIHKGKFIPLAKFQEEWANI